MAELAGASLDSPSEVRTFDKGKAELVHVGDNTVGRFRFEPGWKWSESVKPVVNTETCQSHHVGVVVSGKLHVEMTDGTTAEVGPGDVYEVPPGHDAWVVGDEAFVGYEFKSAADYGKPS